MFAYGILAASACEEFPPLVELARQLSRPSLTTFEAVVAEIEKRGFEEVRLPPISIREDIVALTANAIFRKANVLIHVFKGVGVEGDRKLSTLSLHLSSKGASLPETIDGVSRWLRADPEFPKKSAQFTVLESDAGWAPISSDETRAWYEEPSDPLAHISVDKTETGVSIIRIVTRAS